MAFCPNCGAKLSPNAKFCESCGTKVGGNTPVVQEPVSPAPPQQPVYQAPPSPTVYNAPPVKVKKPITKKWWFWVLVVIIAASLFSPKKSGKASSSDSSKPVNTATSAPTSTSATNQKPINVFYMDLVHDHKSYEGKYVQTTFPIAEINSSGEIRSETVRGTSLKVKSGDKSYYNNKSLNYATVNGVVSYNTYIYLDNPDILYIGNSAPENYTAELNEYTELVKLGKIEARNNFINECEAVSYSDLSRYPDTYQDKKLKLTVSIKEVEADGLLSNGTVKATYSGGELYIYDHRELREPRLKAGDYLTIYATGDGLTTVKTVASGTGLFGSDLGADVVATRDVVSVKMIYTDWDNIDGFGLSVQNSDSLDAYYKELGQEVVHRSSND